MLILQFAHDLFDGVLDGDHAGDAAILVHDDGHMLPGSLHLVEQIVHGLRFGNQHGVTHNGCHVTAHCSRIEGCGTHRILQIGHAHKIIHVLAYHRHT